MTIRTDEQSGISMATFEGPSDAEKERARLAVCANAESPEEATLFLKMLGLL